MVVLVVEPGVREPADARGVTVMVMVPEVEVLEVLDGGAVSREVPAASVPWSSATTIALGGMRTGTLWPNEALPSSPTVAGTAAVTVSAAITSVLFIWGPCRPSSVCISFLPPDG